jgi:hypothetical protein
MGGQGSGRKASFGRETVDCYHMIDVNRLNRRGCLCTSSQSSITWTCRGVETAQIQLVAKSDRIHISNHSYAGGRWWQNTNQVVGIEHTFCHLGGSRPYFVCPGEVNGVACARRVTKLYGAGRYFLCRHCHNLGYACQREQMWDRKARRAGKIRRRLGGEAGIYCSFPEKPKGMWWRTYERLARQADEAASDAEQAILARR